MKRYILTLFTAFTLIAGSGQLALAGTAYADSVDSAKHEVCQSIKTEAGGACGAGANTIEGIFRGVLNILSVIAGLAAVIMIIVSGIKYITSGGDSNAISGAKQTLLYAIIGLIIAVFAQAIVWFVLRKTLGANA